MSKVRILHLFSSFDLGGKEARAVRLMNHFGGKAKHTVLSAV
ncbi:MAG TPA: glycosyltransferase family 1 protein, partial [Sphingorhabdus sp.]|nr:glycosyltransferase family 1 protein [Sphingorhabdus sp.]